MLAALALASTLAAAAADPPDYDPSRGVYARQAVPVWVRLGVNSRGSVTVRSPDGRSSVTATQAGAGEDRVRLRTSGRIGVRSIDLGRGIGSELQWSPDSRAFFVTTSDQGVHGAYRTLVVGPGQRRPVVRDLTALVSQAFGSPVACAQKEPPNVVGVGWRDRSRTVVVAAEIIAHINCDSAGSFRAYEVDWTRPAITRSLDQIEAKQAYAASLGYELAAARDDCIRSPRLCWVVANHPELQIPN